MEQTSRRAVLGGLAILAGGTALGTRTWAALTDHETVHVTGRQRQDLTVTKLTAAEYNNLQYEQAYIGQGRIGSFLATEHRLGLTLNNPAQTAYQDWSNGETRGFTLVHDPTTGQAQYLNQRSRTLTYSPSDQGPYTDLLIAAQSASTGIIQLQSLQLNGRSLNAELTPPSGVGQALRIQGLPFEKGFSLTGTARMAWSWRPSASSQFYWLQAVRVTSGTAAARDRTRANQTISNPSPVNRSNTTESTRSTSTATTPTTTADTPTTTSRTTHSTTNSMTDDETTTSRDRTQTDSTPADSSIGTSATSTSTSTTTTPQSSTEASETATPTGTTMLERPPSTTSTVRVTTASEGENSTSTTEPDAQTNGTSGSSTDE